MFRKCRALMIWLTAVMLCAQTVCTANLSACCCQTNSETDPAQLSCCQTRPAEPAQSVCCHLKARQTENGKCEFQTTGCSCSQNELPALPDRSQTALEILLHDLNLQPACFVGFSQAAITSCQIGDVAVTFPHSQRYAQVLYCVALI